MPDGLFVVWYTQVPERLKNDFLGGSPSAAKILIELKVFSKASFQLSLHALCE